MLLNIMQVHYKERLDYEEILNILKKLLPPIQESLMKSVNLMKL